MSVEAQVVEDVLDVRVIIPHDKDPVVISVVTAGRKVHRLSVD